MVLRHESGGFILNVVTVSLQDQNNQKSSRGNVKHIVQMLENMHKPVRRASTENHDVKIFEWYGTQDEFVSQQFSN